MPLTGNFAELRSLQRKFVDLATPGSEGEKTILGAVKRRLKPVLAKQYRGGQPVAGGAWEPKKTGGQAMQSRKLASAISIKLRNGAVLVVYMIKWLEAHDRGHVFPARQGGGQILTWGQRGGLLTKAKARRRKWIFEHTVGPHQIGARILPPRQQMPRTTTPAMASAIIAGFRAGMAEWHRGGAR